MCQIINTIKKRRHVALALASEAYVLLLQIPATDLLRVKNQYTYAGLRDFIADKTGQEPKAVQDMYEEHARLLMGERT